MDNTEYWIARAVVDAAGEGAASRPWPKVGAMFRSKEGFLLSLDALPVGGQIYLSPAKKKEGEDESPSGE